MVSLITGASRGIGRGIAIELARGGHDLVINYATNAGAARQTAADCVQNARHAGKSIRVEIAQADVSVPDDRRKLIDFTRTSFGQLNVLVNNAGIGSARRPDILETTEEEFDHLLAVNLKGPFFLTQLAAQWMIDQASHPATAQPDSMGTRQRPADQDGGSGFKIITISSISAYTASTNRADYCIAKAALGMMTQLYAARLAAQGIRVYEIRPGIIATDMTAPVKEKYDQWIAGGLTPMPRWGIPEDVGRAVAMLAGNALPFSTGEIINVDGGFHIRRL
ncbi:MAG: 3-oxoacyl-[acyl-carrier protein] reductase [Verrucomicrobiota bacterium]|jgi:NAD(P)-dependent dehydrogenase (short-subunit alcohol dehydrogenase family)